MLRIALSYTLAEIPFFVQWIDRTGAFTPRLYLEVTSPGSITEEASWVAGNGDWEKHNSIKWRFRRENDDWSEWIEENSGFYSRTHFDSTWTYAEALWGEYLSGGGKETVFQKLREVEENQKDLEAGEWKKLRLRRQKKQRTQLERTIRKIEALGPRRIVGKGPVRFEFNGWVMALWGRYLRCRKDEVRLEVQIANFEDAKAVFAAPEILNFRR